MSKKFTTRIQHKRATEAEWLKAKNFTPLEGELIIYEVDAAHKTPRFKIGDGSIKVNDLPFFNAANLATMGKDSFSAGAGIRLSGQTFEVDVIGTIGPIDLSTLSIYSNVSAGATSIQIKSTSPITKELFDKLQEVEYNGIIVQIGNEIVPIKNYDSFERVSIIPLAYKATLYLMDGFTIQSAISAGTAITEVYMGGAVGEYSFASNNKSLALGDESHAEGSLTTTTKEGIAAHAEGYLSIADGLAAHAEGTRTTASAGNAHAEGYRTIASGGASHAEGNQTKATSDNAHAEGNVTEATAASAHAEGYNTKATATAAHAEGTSSRASANDSHAEGYSTTAGGNAAHAEGWISRAQNPYSHAEGLNTTASGDASHAEGSHTVASGTASHAEGIYTHAIGAASHAQGTGSVATGVHSSAFGNTSKAGYGNQFIVGAFNDNKANTVFEVGNGSKEDEVDKNGNVITKNRSNAFEVYHDGRAELKKQGTTDNSVVIKSGLKTINGESIVGSGDIKVTSSVTPDWNQNDETALDYVKNRTHYVKPQVDITWDGNMEGKHTIRLYDNCYDVKVSDEAYPIELFNGGALEIRLYEDHSVCDSTDNLNIAFFDVHDGAFSLDWSCGADFTVVTDANAYNQSFGNNLNGAKYENGIYFRASLGEVYTSKLTIPENVIKIDEKYIPRIKPLFVTLASDGMASHTPKEMYEHIQKGGSVYIKNRILTFIDYREDDPENAFAEFSSLEGEDGILDVYQISSSGAWERFHHEIISDDQVVDIIKSYGIDTDTEREETIINNTLRADSGLILGDDIRMGGMGITQLLVYEDDDTSAVNKGYVDNQFLQLGLSTSEHENYGTQTVIDNPLLMNNAIDMNHDFIYNVMSPINDNDAANKAYVDAPKSHIVLTDSVTNINYKLSIADGKLTMEVVE